MDQEESRNLKTTHDLADEGLTQAVLASFAHSKSARLQQIVESLVRHLHAFVSEVQLTEAEWFKGIDFLTRTGHITTDKRQEFISSNY
jgi:hydroxyquinol 1,2-dioxygenase